MAHLLRVCKLSELDEGDSKVVSHGDVQILVLKHGGRVYAVSNICTHDYAELVNGIVMEGTVTCPVHLSRFRLENGEVLNPPATKPLKTYRVHVVGDEIFVEV
ncbi:MAG: non-heme iron oxygenase ferredoxin subunit [Candidatus Caldarchaeum sp.]|nr:non-heme iron oxygenase ferredoxin subunit [Candidatus Caldarchaeum sp.]